MFDKMKARVAKLEETNENFNKVMTHLRENKKMYYGVGIGIAGTLIVKKSPLHITNTNTVAPIISPEMNNTINNIVVQALGDPGNVIQCIETGTIYASQGQAARELGLSLRNLSLHVNGLQEAVNGLHFEKLGKAGHILENHPLA